MVPHYVCLGHSSSYKKFTFRYLPRILVSLPATCFGLRFKESLDGGRYDYSSLVESNKLILRGLINQGTYGIMVS